MRIRWPHVGIMAAMILLIMAFARRESSAPQASEGIIDAATVSSAPSVSHIAARPIRLRIPGRGIDAPIEPVGLTAEGGMGIPESSFTLGWHAVGARPGERGSAVVAGHRDTPLGTPGVFWTLQDVQPGEAVVIETEDGKTLRFIVQGSEIYPHDRAPMERIFGSASGRYLNLITCAGYWNSRTYTDRLVVYAVLDELKQAN